MTIPKEEFKGFIKETDEEYSRIVPSSDMDCNICIRYLGQLEILKWHNGICKKKYYAQYHWEYNRLLEEFEAHVIERERRTHS